MILLYPFHFEQINQSWQIPIQRLHQLQDKINFHYRLLNLGKKKICKGKILYIRQIELTLKQKLKIYKNLLSNFFLLMLNVFCKSQDLFSFFGAYISKHLSRYSLSIHHLKEIHELFKQVFNNGFKSINSLHNAIPVLRFHAGHTHDFLDGDGLINNSEKIKKIEILGMGCTSHTTKIFQSLFIEYGGLSAFIYMSSQAIAPPLNSVKPANIFINGLIGNIAVITKANVNTPYSSSLISHSVNSVSMGSSKFLVLSSLSIASLIEPINIEPKNSPSITKIIIAPIFFKGSPYLLCILHKDLFCPSRVLSHHRDMGVLNDLL